MWIDDDILDRCGERLVLACWIPKSPIVVLGSSNRVESEVHAAQCAEDGIPILKRYGGGGTVVLYQGCVVLSLGAWVASPFQNKRYFELLNASVIDALAARWPAARSLGQHGLSDIVHGERKIAGTSLFRSKQYLLYQASLIVRKDAAQVERYLQHPSREPEYRKGRSHRDFLEGFDQIARGATPEDTADSLTTLLPNALSARLGQELVDPDPAHIATIKARAAAGKRASG